MWLKNHRVATFLLVSVVISLIGTQVRPQTTSLEGRSASATTIAFVYHGAALDRELNYIHLDRSAIEQVQQSIFDLLAAPRSTTTILGTIGPKSAALLDPNTRETILANFSGSWQALLVARQTLAQRAISLLPTNEREFYGARAEVLRNAIQQLPDIKAAMNDPQLSASITSAKALDLLPFPSAAQPSTNYIQDCVASSVPIPPDWPDPKWIARGELKTLFASFPNSVKTEVFTYEAPGGIGICYALPRKSANDEILALGIICQSRDSGKACFWDNVDPATKDRITGPAISLEIAKIANGYNLAENCTNCHRGGNVFMVHPDTPLESVRARNPKVRYAPIGQPSWDNPPPIAKKGDGACSACHEIGGANAEYCSFLAKAAELTMPPSPDSPSGWDNPTPEYKAHIDYLKGQCGEMLSFTISLKRQLKR